MLDRKTHTLINTLYESRTPQKISRVLLDPKKWRKVLSLREIRGLNEAYAKFSFAEPMIILESGGKSLDRAKLWEQFLSLEDELIHEAPADDRLAAAAGEEQGEKKKGFLSRAWDTVKKAAKAPLKLVAGTRSLSRMGKAGKARESEFEAMKDAKNEIADLIRAMNGNVDNFEEYPNNKSDKEFQEQTIRTLLLADKMIEDEKDPAVRAAMIDAAKKWISYVLDQKLGDFYKHFKEVSVTLGNHLHEEDEANKKKSALSTRSGESETLKGLKSNLAPMILGALGAAGFAAAGILKAHPDLLGSDSVEVISQGSPSQVEELVTQKLGDLKVTDWSAKGSASQVYEHMFGKKPTSSEDFMKLFKTFDPDGADPSKGAKNFFDAVGISNKGSQNSEYVLDRLTKMNPDKAFDMPGVGQMERMGGRAGVGKIVTGLIVRQLKKKAVSGIMTKVMTGAGISTVGAAATGAALAVGAGGILSALAVKALRIKGMKDSRAAFLDNLIDSVGSKVRDLEAEAPTKIETNIDIDSGKVDVKPSTEEEGGGNADDEDEEAEEKKCSDEEIRAKLTNVLKFVKFKKGGAAAVEKMMRSLSSNTPSSLEDLKTILNKNRVKPLKDATITKFAAAIADCFDFDGEDEEVEETGGSDQSTNTVVNKIVDLVSDDLSKYRTEKEAQSGEGKDNLKLNTQISQDEIRKLVTLLRDNNKLNNSFKNDVVTSVDSITDDETFIKGINASAIEKYKSNDSLKSIDFEKQKLPLYLLANRGALLEVLRLINKHAKLLSESNRPSGKVIFERWQKMAGILT